LREQVVHVVVAQPSFVGGALPTTLRTALSPIMYRARPDYRALLL
jgi:hypothetical protein